MPIITWDALNAIVPNEDLLLNLLGPNYDDDEF